MVADWNESYLAKGEEERSWTQSEPAESLRFVLAAALSPTDPIIDIGGGSSRLVDRLLERSFTDVTVLDLAEAALAESRGRLGDAGIDPHTVTWIATDLLDWTPDRKYSVWHDRAVFHFLVDDDDQTAYRRLAASALAPGGRLVVGTFAPDGPEMCSGLPVRRWSASEIIEFFRPWFEPLDSDRLDHHTPWDSLQPFTWVHLRRTDRELHIDR